MVCNQTFPIILIKKFLVLSSDFIKSIYLHSNTLYGGIDFFSEDYFYKHLLVKLYNWFNMIDKIILNFKINSLYL